MRAPSPSRTRSLPPRPNSATKAGADLLVQSYFHTYGLQALICRGSNNYGPYQYPEKLIPLMILNALHGDRLPVYGDGMQVRNWIHASDFAAAIGHVLEHGAPRRGLQRGRPRRGGEHDRRAADHRADRRASSHRSSTWPTVPARRRYSLSSEKVRALGWQPRVGFEEGLEQTVAWYRENGWCGSRSAPETTRRITRGSTGVRSATEPTSSRFESPTPFRALGV